MSVSMLPPLPATSVPATRPQVNLPQAEMPARREPAFAASAELGEQLLNLEKAQIEIDRHKAEELAHLRELQDRD